MKIIPHFVSTTIDQQLQKFRSERDIHKEESSITYKDSLYKKISQFKEKENHTTLKKYCSILNKFKENQQTNNQSTN